MITEILVLIVSWLGVFTGRLIGKHTKEEVDFGKSNLSTLQFILFILIIILFFYFVKLTILYKLLIAVVLMLLVYFTKNNYTILGVMFGLEPSFILGSLIFLYGFPTGSLMKENYVKIAKKTYVYLVLGLVSLMIRKYLLG